MAAPKAAIGRPSPALAAAPKAAAGRASVGEIYGAEGWREEEVLGTEMDADAPELDELEAEMDGAELGGEDESEW